MAKGAPIDIGGGFGGGGFVPPVNMAPPPPPPPVTPPMQIAQAPPVNAPAAIRYNNPGAMWPGPSSQRFGSTSAATIGGGNRIASFPDPESGAAAMFDLLQRRYAGMPLDSAIARWSGNNSPGAYAQTVSRATGLPANATLTPEMLRGPQGLDLARAMSRWEAGRDFPLDAAGWARAQQRAFGGAAPPTRIADASTTTLPSRVTQPRTVAPTDPSALARMPQTMPGEAWRNVTPNTWRNLEEADRNWIRQTPATPNTPQPPDAMDTRSYMPTPSDRPHPIPQGPSQSPMVASGPQKVMPGDPPWKPNWNAAARMMAAVKQPPQNTGLLPQADIPPPVLAPHPPFRTQPRMRPFNSAFPPVA